MSFNKELFGESFFRGNLQNWPCPICSIGKLNIDDGEVNVISMVTSKAKKFSGELYCTNKRCQEKITIAGLIIQTPAIKKVTKNKAVTQHALIENVFYPLFFLPTLKLFEVPNDFPVDLEEAIENVFKLFWIDKSACANAIRKIVEEILNDQRVPKTFKTKTGKRNRIFLHDRIESFKKKKAEPANYLLAVKWIGNYGSHPDYIQNEDILDGLEILEKVILKLYSDEEKRVSNLVKKINKNKRPIN